MSRRSPKAPESSSPSVTFEQLNGEIATLRERLREAEETLDAIRNGDVDAVVVSGVDNVPRVYTLETADESYRLLVQEMQEGALTLTASGDVLYCNARLGELVGLPPERVIGGSLRRFIGAEDWPAVRAMIQHEEKGEIEIRAQEGRRVPAHVSFSAIRGGHQLGEDVYCCIVTDLTEQRRTSDQLQIAHEALLLQVAERERTERLLRQSQKMEAVGQLTGGIAHDFNNLLMVITGGLSMLERNPPEERRRRLRDGMRQAADRGAALTRQLLAFSRQKELFPKAITIPHHVGGMRDLLNGSLGGDIVVKTDFDAAVWPVQADEGELQIALLNLCVNARDAMPGGGTITISARNRPSIDDYELSGDFVELSVADTGHGMDAETISRCLEPFYTTKDVGKGSGLGLAQVYGFTRGSRGSVRIDSKPGEGTQVRLLLPRALPTAAFPEDALDPGPAASAVDAACRVLLVEDDASVAALTSDMLQELGYDVLHVPSAQEGLLALGSARAIGLVLSDVMMPGGMDGLAFVREMRKRDFHLPVVLMSGYAEAIRRDAEKADIPLLAKPYRLDDLAHMLSTVLARARERRRTERVQLGARPGNGKLAGPEGAIER